MNDFNRITAVYADDLQLQREQVVRRTRRGQDPGRGSVRHSTRVRWNRWDDRDGVGPR